MRRKREIIKFPPQRGLKLRARVHQPQFESRGAEALESMT